MQNAFLCRTDQQDQFNGVKTCPVRFVKTCPQQGFHEQSLIF